MCFERSILLPASNYSVDIDNEDTLNYNYDQIGNLMKDSSAGLDSIYWTVYGKIQQIVKFDGDTIKFPRCSECVEDQLGTSNERFESPDSNNGRRRQMECLRTTFS